MKRIGIILCMIVISFTGCDSSEDFYDFDTEFEEASSSIANDESEQKLTLTSMSVKELYSDGCAWVGLSSDEYSFTPGIVNKEGEVVAIFSGIDSEFQCMTEFEDGYAFLIFNSKVLVVNTNGDIVSEQQLNEDRQLVSYGAGCLVLENHIHDFDHNSYEYVIYNPQGEELTKYLPSDGKSHDVTSMGGGVFSFSITTEEWKNTNDTYFVKSDKWVQRRIGRDSKDALVTFGNSDKRVIDCSQDGESGILTIMDKEGNITDYRLSIKPEHPFTIEAHSLVSDDYCLIIDGDSYWGGDSVSVLDLNTGIQTKMEDAYFEKVHQKINWYEEYNIFFENGVFSIPLDGDDGEWYIGLFDTQCNLISDPIQVDSYDDYSFSNGRVVVSGRKDSINFIETYDVNGQQLYALDVDEYLSLSDLEQKYSDDVFIDITCELDNIRAYDLDGNNLYTNLDTADTVIVSCE